jgi:hypothetical protein
MLLHRTVEGAGDLVQEGIYICISKSITEMLVFLPGMNPSRGYLARRIVDNADGASPSTMWRALGNEDRGFLDAASAKVIESLIGTIETVRGGGGAHFCFSRYLEKFLRILPR